MLGQQSQHNPFLSGKLVLTVGFEEEIDDRRIENPL